MPAAANGRFFFSMSLQISRIFVIMLFVALASLSYVSSPRVCAPVKTRDRERRSAQWKAQVAPSEHTPCVQQVAPWPFYTTPQGDRTTVKTANCPTDRGNDGTFIAAGAEEA